MGHRVYVSCAVNCDVTFLWRHRMLLVALCEVNRFHTLIGPDVRAIRISVIHEEQFRMRARNQCQDMTEINVVKLQKIKTCFIVYQIDRSEKQKHSCSIISRLVPRSMACNEFVDGAASPMEKPVKVMYIGDGYKIITQILLFISRQHISQH